MGFEGLSQRGDTGFALWASYGPKTTTLPSGQGLQAIGPAARAWAHCQSLAHLSVASDAKGSPHSHSAPGRTAGRHRQTHESCSMKISSQPANNFPCCSTEKRATGFLSPFRVSVVQFRVFPTTNSP